MKRYLSIITILLCLELGLAHGLHAQNSQGETIITVNNRYGAPVTGATVWYNEGALSLKTNKEGHVRIDLSEAGPALRIEAKGYEPELLSVDSIADRESVIIRLDKSLFQTGRANLVEIPFGQMEKRRIVGAVSELDPEKLLQYDNSQDILGAISGRVAGVYGSRNIRGLGTAIVVIDGIPRSDPDNSSRLNMVDDLDLLDVKSITVLRDATSEMLYGAKAGQGVILITTKRGTPYKRQLKVYAETGLNNPVSYPDYLAASDYMILYNEALANDGLAPKYSKTEIDNTWNGNDPLRYPEESYYTDTYLKPNTTFFNVITEASGGNENAQYFASLGFNRDGSIYKAHSGEGAFAQNHLTFRGNVDFKVNSWIAASLDAGAIYNYNRYPNGYYGDSYDGTLFEFASTQLPNSYPTLIPVDQVHDSMLLKSAKLVDGKYLLGGTNQFGNNILGNLVYGGVQSTQQKSIQFNAGLKFNLAAVLQGLTGNAAFTYDFLNSYTLRQNNTYAVYEPSYVPSSSGTDSLVVTQYGTDVKRNDQTVNGNYFQRRYGVYGTLNYQRVFGNVHKVNATALAYMSAYSTGRTSAANFNKNRDQHFGFRANYMFNNKYVAEFDGVYVGSSYLSQKNRYAFSPSAGLAWIISEERFLKGNKFINYLKLKSSYGIVNSETAYNSYRLYNTTYARGSDFDYNNASGNANGVTQFGSIGNPDLGFVKEKELSAGFESSLLHYKIWLEANYFNVRSVGIPVIRSDAYPAYLGGFIPTENYNENKNSGVEAALKYMSNAGKLRYSVGFNMVYAVPHSLKQNEVQHTYKYQYRQGRVNDAIFGYVAEGLFQSEADIAGHAVQSFGTVQPGDIKYKDLNGDGVINDDDRMQIGNSFPRFQYGLNITLKYRNFELFAIGTAQTGSEVFYNNSYYWVYGNRKYSALVLGRWTPATASTATYPRLTTTSGSNNFRNSTYWLYKNDYFTFNRAQLTYHLPALCFWKGLQLYLRGNNLLTISPTKKQRELNIASSPQMRSYAVGIVGSF
jgi:TonB-linked SusC/RagA family outer membrane protein